MLAVLEVCTACGTAEVLKLCFSALTVLCIIDRLLSELQIALVGDCLHPDAVLRTLFVSNLFMLYVYGDNLKAT